MKINLIVIKYLAGNLSENLTYQNPFERVDIELFNFEY